MTLIIYCLVIAVVSLLGGLLPLSKKLSHLRLQVYLSLSAGAMLGAAFFHMLPESAELAGKQFGLWLALGVVGLYTIERFLSPHSHETVDHEQEEEEPAACCSSHSHHSEPHHHAAPRVAGWSAVAGLFIHTLIGGVALGSAVVGEGTSRDLGLAVFLATLLHKPADSLTISTLLIKAGTSKRVALIVQGIFAALIPLGAFLFYAGAASTSGHFNTAFTGSVLAFSAGTFICIALSDLLPEVQFHSHDRLKLFLAMLFGVVLMWATALFEPAHSHGQEHSHPVENHEH